MHSTDIATILGKIGTETGSEKVTDLATVWKSSNLDSGKTAIKSAANLRNQTFAKDGKLVSKDTSSLQAGTLLSTIFDEEFASTIFGKTRKIRNLMNCVASDSGNFNLTSTIADRMKTLLTYTSVTRTTSVLSMGGYCSANDSNFKYALGAPSAVPANETSSTTYTYFGQLNALLDLVRSIGINTTTGVLSATGGDESTLFALTQIGSRGFDPRLVNEIAKIGANGVTATSVLKSKECFDVIFGTEDDTEGATGSVISQLKFVDSKLSGTSAYSTIQEKLTEITEKFSKSKVKSSKLSELYGYLVPIAEYKRLDRLDQTTINTICTNYTTLSIQECLACIMDGDNISTHLTNLATQISTRCDNILDCFETSCCNELYETLKGIENEAHRLAQALHPLALDPGPIARAWQSQSLPAIGNVATSLAGLMDEFHSTTSQFPAVSEDAPCIGKQLAEAIKPFGEFINAMNNALVAASGVPTVLPTTDNSQPEDAEGYCAAVYDLLTVQIPNCLQMVQNSFGDVQTKLEEINGDDVINLSLADLQSLHDVLAAFLATFPETSIEFVPFCNTAYAESPDTTTCNALSHVDEINEKIASIIECINVCQSTIASIHEKLTNKLNHLENVQSLAENINVIDESIFHLSQALANQQFDAAQASLFQTISDKLNAAKVNSALIPELSAAIDSLTAALGSSQGTYTPHQGTESATVCSPCATIIHALAYGIPEHLHEILQTIGRINSEIPTDLALFLHSKPDAETRLTRFKSLFTFLENFVNIIPMALLTEPFCNVEDDCKTCGLDNILSVLDQIRDSVRMGVHQLNTLINEADHTFYCTPHNKIHHSILLKIHQLSCYANAIFSSGDPFALFDRWQEDGTNLMASALAALQAAFDLYPPISEPIYSMTIADFSPFASALDSALSHFATLVGELAPDGPAEPPDTNTLWQLIQDEITEISSILVNGATVIRNTRNCVIPVLFDAFTNLSTSVNGAIDKLALSPTICRHGGQMPPIGHLDFAELASLFKDTCAGGNDYCRSAVTSLTHIFNFLSGQLPSDVNATLEQIIVTGANKLDENDIAGYFAAVAEAIGVPEGSPIDISHRYGTCAQLIEMIDRILQLIPHMHEKMQDLVMTNAVDLVNIGNFSAFISQISDLIAAIKRSDCPTCNGITWKYGNVTSRLTHLKNALDALTADLNANQLAKDVVIPIANTLEAIRADIAAIEDVDGGWANFSEKLVSHNFGNGLLEDLVFLRETISILATGTPSPAPVYTSNIQSFTNELYRFIEQAFNSIVRDIGLLQNKTSGHHQPDIIMVVRHVRNFLPSLKTTFLQFADAVNSNELVRCLSGFGAIEAHLQTLLEQLTAPPPCVLAINRVLHKWYTAVSNFVNNAGDFPFFLTSETVTEAGLMAHILSEAESLNEDVATPLQVTLARLIAVFSQMPEKVFSFAATGGPAPEWLANLKQFQKNALVLLRALRNADFAELYDYDAYGAIVSTIKLSPLEQLNANITFAIMDLERSLRTCELIDRVRSIYEKAYMLHAQSSLLLKLADEDLDQYVARLEALLITPIPGPPSSAYLDGIDAALDFLNHSLPSVPNTPEQTLSVAKMFDETTDLMAFVAECFRSLSAPDIWANANAHVKLSRLLRFIGGGLEGFLNSTEFPDSCDVCLVNANQFLQYYVWALSNIQKSCVEAAELCEACTPCRALVNAVFSLAQLTKSITKYSVTFPNYDFMNNIIAVLQEIHFPDGRSCDNAAEYIDAFCHNLESICETLFGPGFSRENAAIPAGDPCKLLEVAYTQIYDSLDKIVGKLSQVLYNAQAPPIGTWHSIKDFADGIAAFADRLGASLINITPCLKCNSVAFSEISRLRTVKLDSLKTQLQQVKTQWDSFEAYAANTEFLTVLHNFYEMHTAIYVRARQSANVDALLDNLQIWADFAGKFAMITEFTKEHEFLAQIGYDWQTPVFTEPTQAFIADYIKEIAGVSRQILITLNYVRDYLNQEITQLDENTLNIISKVKSWPDAWRHFIGVISELKTATTQNIPIEIPLAFTESLDQICQVLDDIVNDLAGKPSLCQERGLQLAAVVQILSELSDATTLDAICVDHIRAQICAIASALSTSQVGSRQDCKSADVASVRINSLLEKINFNLTKIIGSSDWESVNESAVDVLQSTLKSIYSALHTVPLQARPCTFCNHVSTAAHETERLLLVEQIANSLIYIHDQLVRAKGTQKKHELSVVSAFCANLAAYFNGQFRTNYNIREFEEITARLQQSLPSVGSWLGGNFAEIAANIEASYALSYISANQIVCPSNQPIDWYYLHLQDSFSTILRTLIFARQSAPYEVGLVSAVRNFSSYAANLRQSLLTTLSPSKRSSLAAVLNLLYDIANEGDLWTYTAPAPDNSAMLDAYRQMESLAQNLKKIDTHMSGQWADIADWSILFPEGGSPLEQMFNAVRKIAELVNAPAVISTATHEKNAVLATRLNFWLEQAANTLDSIIHKLEQNHTVAIPDSVRQQLLRLRIGDIGPVTTSDDYEIAQLRDASLQPQQRIHQQIAQIANVLLGKCCAPESHFFSELATEFHKISAFFETLAQGNLDIPNVNPIISNILGMSPTLYTEHVGSPDFLQTMRALTSLLPTAAEQASVHSMHNCKRKRVEMDKIREYICQIGTYVRIFAENLGDLDRSKNLELQEFIHALQHLCSVWHASLPNAPSTCCGIPEAFFSHPLAMFQDELQRVAELLTKVHYSTELPNKMLELLQSLESAYLGVKARVSSNIGMGAGSASDSAFETLLNEIASAFAGIEAHTRSFDSIFEVSKYVVGLIGTNAAAPYEPHPRDAFDFTIFKISEVVQKFSDSFRDVFSYWYRTPPKYSATTYNYLVQILNLVSYIRSNVSNILSQPIDAVSNQLQFLKTKLENLLQGRTLTQLASFYATLKDAENGNEQIELVNTLQKLHHAISLCASHPQTQNQVGGTIYNTVSPTDMFVRTWINGLQQVEQVYTTADKSAFLAGVRQFAEDIIQYYTGGPSQPLPMLICAQATGQSFLAISTLIDDFIDGIHRSVRQLFQVYLTQPYAQQTAYELGLATISFCQNLAAFLQNSSASEAGLNYSLQENTISRMAFRFHELADYLRISLENYESSCCQNNSIDSIRIEFEKLTKEVSLLVGTLNSTNGVVIPSDRILGVADSIDAFLGLLNSAAAQLAQTTPNVLCQNWASLISENANGVSTIRENVRSISLTVNASILAVQEPTPLQGSTTQRNSVALARLLYILRDAPDSLINSFLTLEQYSARATQIPYDAGLVTGLNRIMGTIQQIKGRLQTISVASACAPYELPFVVNEMAQTLGDLASKMPPIIRNIRLRLWTPYAQQMHTLRIGVETHARYLQRLSLAKSSNIFKGDTANSAYRALDTQLDNILRTLNAIAPVQFETNDEMSDAEIQAKLNAFKTFVDAFSASMLPEFGAVADIFELANDTISVDAPVETFSFASINEDVKQILETFTSLAAYVTELQSIAPGFGYLAVQKRLQNIAVSLGAQGPLAKILQVVLRAYSVTSGKFYDDASIPVADRSGEVPTIFSTLSNKISALAEKFQIERCHDLIQTYATNLAVKMQRLNYALSKAGDGFDWRLLGHEHDDGGITHFLHEITASMGRLSEHLSRHFTEQTDTSDYCQAGIVDIYVNQICATIDGLAKLLHPEPFPEFGALATSGSNHDATLELLRTQNLAYIENIAKFFSSLTDFARTHGPKVSRQNLDNLAEVQHALIGINSAIPAVCDTILKMCTHLTPNASQQFILNLMGSISSVHRHFVELTDVLSQFCCDAEQENALIGLAGHAKAFVHQLKAMPFDHQSPTLISQFGTLLSNLAPAIKAYFTASPHTEQQTLAINSITGVLMRGDPSPVSRVVPFNENAKGAYAAQVVEGITELLQITRGWTATFPATAFSQNPQAIRTIDKVLPEFSQFLNLFAATDLNNSVLHNSRQVEMIRNQVQLLFGQMFDALVALKQAYIKNDYEIAIRNELHATQQIVAALPAALEIILRKIEGAESAELSTKATALLSRLPSYAQQPLINLSSAALQLENAWKNAEFLAGGAPVASIANVKDGLASINSILRTYVCNLLEVTNDLPSTYMPKDLYVSVALSSVGNYLTDMYNTMIRIGSAIQFLEFDEAFILQITREDGPLALLLESQGCVRALSHCLHSFPAYTSCEWALILKSFDETFEKLRSAFFGIKDAVHLQRHAQELQPYRRIYGRLHQISEAINGALAGSTLMQAENLFKQLRIWLPQMLADVDRPEAHCDRLDELYNIIAGSIGKNVSLHNEPLGTNRFGSISYIQGLIQSDISCIENVLGGLIPLWLRDTYKLNPELITDVSIVLEQLAQLPVNLDCASGYLQDFLQQLKRPTFCNERNLTLGKIEADVAAISRTLKTISRNVHFLSDPDAASLVGVIPQMATQIGRISTLLEGLPEYEDANYKGALDELFATIATMKEQLSNVAALFGVPSSNAHAVDSAPCEQAGVFITRLTHHTCEIQNDFRILIDNIVPTINAVAPFHPELIRTVQQDLAPALLSLLNALHAAVNKAPDAISCELHNQFATNELAKEIRRQVAIMTAYPLYLSEKLAQFEQSLLGRNIRTLRDECENLQLLLGAFADVTTWNNEMLALADGHFHTLQTLLLETHKNWTQQLNNENCFTVANIGAYIAELRGLLGALGRPAPLQISTPLATFGPTQIADDVAAIQRVSRVIFDVFLPQICQQLVRTPLYSPSLAGVFKTLSFFAEAKPTFATDETRKHILDSLWPTLPVVTLHQLEFILKNPTCCQAYTDEIARIIGLYTGAKHNLDQMSAVLFNHQISDPLSKAQGIQNMLGELNAFKTVAAQIREKTDALILQMECAASLACFSDRDTQLMNTLKCIGDYMQTVNGHTAQIYSMHCSINDLNPNEGATNPSFGDFADNLKQLNVFYDDDIVTAWNEINELLESQYIAMQTVRCILTQTPVCFWRGASFLEQFSNFDDLEAYIRDSKLALAAYKSRSLAQSSMHLYRIHQQLQPIVMLERILLRKTTLDDANTCVGVINAALEQVHSLLTNLHSSKVHSLAYLDGLSKIEARISQINAALAGYARGIQIIEPTFDNSLVFGDADFTKYIQDILADLNALGLLQSSLSRWKSTLTSEDGTGENERCYTNVFATTKARVENISNAFAAIATNLGNPFVSSFASTTLPPNIGDTLKSLFQQMATNLAATANTIAEIDSLAQTPTCCYRRLVNASNLYKEVDAIRLAILAVTENLAANVFNSQNDYAPATQRMEAAASSLRNIYENLADVTINHAHVCQATPIVTQTVDVILPAVQLAVGELCEALTLVSHRTITPAAFPVDGKACNKLLECNQTLELLAEQVTNSLILLGDRLASIDLFAYSPEFVRSLKTLLYELLHVHGRLDQFCQSFEANSCNTCQDVNHGGVLRHFSNSFRVFENIIHIIERNECKQHSKTLHSLANAAEVLAQNVRTLLATNYPNLDDTPKLSEAISSLFAVVKDATSVALGEPLVSMPAFTTLLDTATSRVCAALGIQVARPNYTSASYGQALIDEDNARLIAAFKTLKTAIRFAQAEKGHLATISHWGTLAEATHQLARKFLDSGVNPHIAQELLSTYDALIEFTDKLRQLEYCKPVDAAIEGFSGLIADFVSMFRMSVPSFINNLSDEDSQAFAAHISVIATHIDGLSSDITSVAHAEQATHICTTDYTSLGNIRDKIAHIRNATIGALQCFNPSAQLPSPPQPEGVAKNVTLRRIVENLHMLQQAMSAAWAEAKRCPIRDYRQCSITASKALISAFNSMVSNINKVFGVTSICHHCNPEEARLIFGEIQPILSQISSELTDAVTYMESMCCSRLAAQTHDIADRASVLDQYLQALKSKSAKDLVDWLSNDQVGADAARLTGLLTTNLPGENFSLVAWSKFASSFANSEDSHCSAREVEKYFNHWIAFLDETIGVLNAHLPNSFASTLVRPDIYDCTTLPAAVALCVNSVSNISASLHEINEKIQDGELLYSKTINVYILLRGFKAALKEFSTIGLGANPIAFCSKCNYEGALTQLWSPVNPFESLESQIDALIETLTKYCNYEFIKHWHSFLNSVDFANAILEGLNVAAFWNKLDLTTVSSGLKSIGEMYASTSGAYSMSRALKLISTFAPVDDQICQMAYLLPYVALFDSNFNQITNTMVTTFGAPGVTKNTSLPPKDNLVFVDVLAKIVEALKHSNTAFDGILNDIKKGGLTGDTTISSFFTSVGNGLQEQSEVFKKIYEKWKSKLPCPVLPDCQSCDDCIHCLSAPPYGCTCGTHPSVRYQLWQLANELAQLSEKMARASQVISPDCCKEAFEHLFDTHAQIRTVQYNVEDVFNWDFILEQGNLTEFTEILFQEFGPVCAKLNEIVDKCKEVRSQNSNTNCHMDNFVGAFLALKEAFGQPIAATSAFIRDHGISTGTRQEVEILRRSCSELARILPSIRDEFALISDHFNNLAHKISQQSIIIREAIEPLMNLYNRLVSASKIMDELVVPENERQICLNCDKNVINNGLTEIQKYILEWASAVLSVKNAFLAKYCCENFGQGLAQTDHVMAQVKRLTSILSTHNFQDEDVYHNVHSTEIAKITNAVLSANQKLTRLLSVRESLPATNPVDFCSVELMVPALNELNEALTNGILAEIQEFVEHLGKNAVLPESPDFEPDICTSFNERLHNISTSIGEIFQHLSGVLQQIKSIQLVQSPEVVKDGVYVVEELFHALSQTQKLLNSLALSTEHKKVCENCDCHVVVRNMHAQFTLPGVIAELHLYLHDNQHLNIATALSEFLNSYGIFTSFLDHLHLVSSIDTLLNDTTSPHFGEAKELIRSWNDGFLRLAHLFPQITALQQEKGRNYGMRKEAQFALIQKLNDIRLAFDEMAVKTRSFVTRATGDGVEAPFIPALDIHSAEYADKFMVAFNKYSSNAAEALQWFGEFCASRNIKARDTNTLATIVEFVRTMNAWRHVEKILPQCAVGDFCDVATRVKDTLTPQEIDVVSELNKMALLFGNAAQNLRILERDPSISTRFSPINGDVNEYVSDLNQLFSTLTAFAHWSRQINDSENIANTLQSAPVFALQEVTQRIGQHFGIQEAFSATLDSQNFQQALVVLGRTIHAFVEALFYFANNVADVHLQHRIEIDMRLVANAKTAAFIVQNELANLTRVKEGELGAVVRTIERSRQTLDKLSATLTHVQDTVRNLKRQDKLDALSCDADGVPVMKRLFSPLHDAHGMPMLLSEETSVISTTGILMDDAKDLCMLTLGQPA
jgi:hypothetical protein